MWSTRQELETALALAGLGEWSPRLAASARHTIILEPGPVEEGADTPIGASRVGGMPDLPSGYVGHGGQRLTQRACGPVGPMGQDADDAYHRFWESLAAEHPHAGFDPCEAIQIGGSPFAGRTRLRRIASSTLRQVSVPRIAELDRKATPTEMVHLIGEKHDGCASLVLDCHAPRPFHRIVKEKQSARCRKSFQSARGKDLGKVDLCNEAQRPWACGMVLVVSTDDDYLSHPTVKAFHACMKKDGASIRWADYEDAWQAFSAFEAREALRACRQLAARAAIRRRLCC